MKGTRLPPDWAPSQDLLDYAESVGVSNTHRMELDFCEFWWAKATDATKLRWDLAWKTWARRQGDRDKEKAAREQRYQQRYAPATGLLLNSDRRQMQRFQPKVETKSPEPELTPLERAVQQAEINERLKRMGIQRTMQ